MRFNREFSISNLIAMYIVYLQLELEAWRSGRGKQQSDERRDSENPHPAKEKLQRKTETQNSLKTGAILLHIYLCPSLCSLYFYVLSFLFIALESWLKALLFSYGARTPEIQYCVGSTPFLTDWECVWTDWGREGMLASPPSPHRPLVTCSGVYLRRRMASRTLVTREMLLG